MYRCPDAVARIRGGADAPHLYGEVRFYQECGNVLVVADIAGLPTSSKIGFFALHIHEGNSFTLVLLKYIESRSVLNTAKGCDKVI